MAPWQLRRNSWLLAALSLVLLLVSTIFAAPASAVTLDEAARGLRKGDRVYDYARVLSRTDQQRLQDQLEDMEQKGLAQGAIVIADRLEGVTIEEFTLGLGEQWKIGRADSDNGFVLAVSIQDRKWRLEPAGDLQGALPDAVAARLMRDELVPAFKEGQYALGFERLLNALEARLERAGGVEALPTHPVAPRPAPLFLLATLLLGAGTVGVAFASWPRGTVPGRDPWKLPGIGLGFGALACALLGMLQTPGSGIGLLLVGLAPAAWAGTRLLEASWTPLALNDATRLNSTVSRTYWAVVAGGDTPMDVHGTLGSNRPVSTPRSTDGLRFARLLPPHSPRVPGVPGRLALVTRSRGTAVFARR